MNQVLSILIVLLVLILVVFLVYKFTQNQIKKVLSGEKSLDDKDIWMRHAEPMPALVISKKETLNPKAAGIAKVDLELEVHVPEGSRVQTSTCWLVEVPSLSELEPGKVVEVKFDPKKPQRVYPAVPWARVWLFSK